MRGCSLALTSPRALAARRGQLTLGVGNDRYVWMIKLWPLLYGGTTPQFALTVADWMHYTWVVMWCHCQVFFDVPVAGAGGGAAALDGGLCTAVVPAVDGAALLAEWPRLEECRRSARWHCRGAVLGDSWVAAPLIDNITLI